MPSQARPTWPRYLAFIVLLVAGLAAAGGLVFIIIAYVGSVQTAGNLEAAVTGFRLIEDDNPRAEMTLTISSDSLIPLRAEKCMVELEHGDRYIATSQSGYVGTDPNTAKHIYEQQTAIAQDLSAGRRWDTQLTLYIQSREMEIARLQRAAGVQDWYAQVTVLIVMPYSQRREFVTRRVAIQEPP